MLKGKQRENVEKFSQQAILSKELVTIDRAVPVELDLESMKIGNYNSQELIDLFIELEFKTLGKRLLGDDFSEVSILSGKQDSSESVVTIKDIEHNYVLIETMQERAELIGKLVDEKEFSFDLETTGLDVKECGIIGIAFSWEKGSGYFVKLPPNESLLSKFWMNLI